MTVDSATTLLAGSSWQQRDAAGWSNGEVRAFLETVLPGHPCAAGFMHTSGKVLCSLSKDDLRRQARDEEATNVIWAELARAREAFRQREETAAQGAHPCTIFVRTPADLSIELEVVPTDTVAEVKARLAVVEGTPVEQQRLTRMGIPMLDARTLASYKVSHGQVLLLVPKISVGGQRYTASNAGPAALAMAAQKQQSAPKPSSGVPRPRVPVVCTDITRPFPMSMEFEGVAVYQSWMLALQRQAGRRDFSMTGTLADDSSAPFLEIIPQDNLREPVQTRINFDGQAEVLLIDTLGDIVMENTRYRVLLHLRDDQKFATLVTGVRLVER